MLAVLVFGGFRLFYKSPLRRNAVIEALQDGTGSQVDIGTFHQRWLPPGFIAGNVRLKESRGAVLTIAQITLTGSYIGLLRTPGMFTDLHATGVRLVVPPTGRKLLSRSMQEFGIETLRVENAEIELLADSPEKQPLIFRIRALRLNHLAKGRPIAFDVALHNPRPSGDIRASGAFGPVNTTDAPHIPVSGAFTFQNADLTVQHSISGVLNASGTFRGRLGRIECTGSADLPQFRVFGSTHAVHISSRFSTAVDATTGDASLDQVVAHFSHTTVSGSGEVMSTPGRDGKTVALDLRVADGRIEDILLLFTHAPVPAMKGAVRLNGKFVLPPKPPGFLTRLRVDGTFKIEHAHFTNPLTQFRTDRLSESAGGESKREQASDPRLVTADIRGAVAANGGIASLSGISFDAPGLHAQLEGTFGLYAKAINMNGVLVTAGKLSDTTSGVNALLLKAMGEVWPKHGSLKSVPFRIGGNASHPIFRLKLRK